MIDKNYIEEIRVLEKKEAKEKLSEYAEQFGIKLKKTKAFENMLQDLEEEFAKLADEPMPDENEGLSISDLIQADDEASGTSIFKDEASDEAKQLLIDSVAVGTAPVEVIEVDEELENKPLEKGTLVLEAPIGDKVVVVTDDGVKEIPVEDLSIDQDKLKEVAVKIREDEILPKDFSPSIHLIGRSPGFVSLPWWIYQWIKDTPDWKEKPMAFEHPSAHQTLLSLIYYIRRDGSVKIRETRNSSFVTLE